jgi:phasin family protein
MLQETMKKVVADAGQEDAKKKRADVAKEGFEKALANMRELAEMTTRSQKEAFDVVRKRIEENMEGIRNFGKKLANELHPLAGAGDLLTSSQLISRRDICRWPLRPAHERPGALPNRQSHLTSPEQAIAHLNQVIARGSDLDTIKRAVNAVTRRSRRISAVKWH